MYVGSSVSTSSPTLVIIWLFDYNPYSGCEEYLIVVFICISPMANDVEPLSVCFLTICRSSWALRLFKFHRVQCTSPPSWAWWAPCLPPRKVHPGEVSSSHFLNVGWEHWRHAASCTRCIFILQNDCIPEIFPVKQIVIILLYHWLALLEIVWLEYSFNPKLLQKNYTRKLAKI